jgi:hypothetical protein
MKFLLLSLITLISFTSCAQIKVDKINHWDKKVDSALTIIKTYDIQKYNLLEKNCSKISFWAQDFNSSTIEEGGIIYISNKSFNNGGDIYDISATIVHESMHLQLRKIKISISEDEEEYLAYEWEIDFLNKIPNVPFYLLEHANNMKNYYRKRI